MPAGFNHPLGVLAEPNLPLADAAPLAQPAVAAPLPEGDGFAVGAGGAEPAPPGHQQVFPYHGEYAQPQDPMWGNGEAEPEYYTDSEFSDDEGDEFGHEGDIIPVDLDEVAANLEGIFDEGAEVEGAVGGLRCYYNQLISSSTHHSSFLILSENACYDYYY